MIPLVNLSALHRRIGPEIMERWQALISEGAFIQGKYVAEFERDFKKANGFKFGLGCSNGTSAISVALSALGIGPGDEVITVPNTFIATAEAICTIGAKPVFVDVDKNTHNLNSSEIKNAINPRTKAILPVHLYGNPVDMDSVLKIAREHELKVIEDCAQAHFATYQDHYVGTFGDAATFSFFPENNLGAFGDAGFVVTGTEAEDKAARRLIDHGRLGKQYEHDTIGSNQRMDGLQAIVLSVKLKHIQAWTETRRQRAKLYDQLLTPSGLKTPTWTKGSHPVYPLYVIEVSNRDQVIQHLEKQGISVGIHYPIPLHLQPAFRPLGYRKGSFPVAERLATRILSLPICSEISVEQVELIANEVKKVAEA